MKILLIGILYLGAKYGQASIVAEFDDMQACRFAQHQLQGEVNGVLVCVPKASK